MKNLFLNKVIPLLYPISISDFRMSSTVSVFSSVIFRFNNYVFSRLKRHVLHTCIAKFVVVNFNFQDLFMLSCFSQRERGGCLVKRIYLGTVNCFYHIFEVVRNYIFADIHSFFVSNPSPFVIIVVQKILQRLYFSNEMFCEKSSVQLSGVNSVYLMGVISE